LEADSFDGITTGDQIWFQYFYEPSAMLAKRPGDGIPRTKKEIGVKKTMFTIFFTNRKLLIAEYLPKVRNATKNTSSQIFVQRWNDKKMRYKRRKHGETLYVHIDHSKSHDGSKIQEKFDRKGFVRCPHPLHSPDLSSCDLCFFGMAKKKRRIANFAQFNIFFIVRRRSGMASLSKMSNLCSVSGRSASTGS
jgi:hypothetical protein